MDIHALMDAAHQRGAADIHLSVGRKPVFRLGAGLVEVGGPVLTPELTEAMAKQIAPAAQLGRAAARRHHRLRLRARRQVPVPRQRADPEGGARPRDAPDPAEAAVVRADRPAGIGAAAVAPAPRPRAGHRPDRFGQDDDAGDDDRLDQQATATCTSSRSRTRSSTTTPQEVAGDAARGRHRRAVVRGGDAPRAAPGPRRDPARRDARPRDDLGGDHRRRDGPPGVRHAAHDRRCPHRRSHHRPVPARAAGADPGAAVACRWWR
jgi:hypothetical protein